MDVQHIYTASEYLDQLPIVDGQLIALKDDDGMFYDLSGVRHSVGSGTAKNAVTVDTEQTVTGRKTFSVIQVDQLTQGSGCSASQGSHAEGQNSAATVPGTYAHAEGGNTQATGKFSHSQGEDTVAEGIGSNASGKSTYAAGDYSSANGVSSVSSGKGSFSSGLLTNSIADYSAAFGISNNPQLDDLFEIGNGTVLDANGELLPEDSQTKSNAFRVTQDGRAIAQSDVELESGIKLSNRESIQNKVTVIDNNADDTKYPTASAVKKYIDSLPEPMVFKGTLGTGGTITALPTVARANEGFTYKVITAGNYAGQSAKVGDTFISTGTKWELVPSGDEPSGTVTNVAAQGSNGIQVTGGPITSSGTLQITGVNATQTAAGMMSAQDKQKLDSVSANASAVSITQSLTSGTEVGTITVGSTPIKLYAPTNTDTHYKTGLKVGASATASANGAATNGNVYLNVLDDSTIRDSHKIVGTGATTVTSDASGNITINSTNTTYNVVSTEANGLCPKRTGTTTKFLRDDGTWAVPPDTTYHNMAAATASTAGGAGLVPAPGAGSQDKFLRGDGTWQTPVNTTYTDFVKSGTGAKSGLVPAPSTTAGTTKYLREDGSWQVPPNTTYSVATTSANGLMSAADKAKLDGLSSGLTLTDDATGTKYTLGVSNGILYIKEVTG